MLGQTVGVPLVATAGAFDGLAVAMLTGTRPRCRLLTSRLELTRLVSALAIQPKLVLRWRIRGYQSDRAPPMSASPRRLASKARSAAGVAQIL